jgi:predicted amidohydrolase
LEARQFADLISMSYLRVRTESFLSGGDIIVPKGYSLQRSTIERAVGYGADFATVKVGLEELRKTRSKEALMPFFYAVIRFIDEFYPTSLSCEYCSPLRRLHLIDKYCLNTCDDHMVRVYAKMTSDITNIIDAAVLHRLKKDNPETTIENGLRAKAEVHSINRELKNYIILESEWLSPMEVRTVRLERRHWVKRVNDDQILKVNFVPNTKESVEELFEVLENGESWTIKGPWKDKKDLIRERYFRNLEHAVRQDPDIVIFPEMCLTVEILQSIVPFIKSLNINRDMIIVAGTIWNEESNHLYVFDEYGTQLLTQAKMSRYIAKGKDGIFRQEGIQIPNSDRLVNLLDIPSLGRFAFFICKDIMEEDVLMFLKQMQVNVLIVPAYTQSYDVLSRVKDLVASFHMIVVLANACGAVGNKRKPLGHVLLPTTTGSKREIRQIEITRSESICEDCITQCGGIVHKIDLKEC